MGAAERFDYYIYVDASGDDGFKLRGGSSLVFAVAALVTKAEDLDFNIDLIKTVKRTGLIKPDQEIKSTSLLCNRRAPDMLSMLSGLRARLYIGLALKNNIRDEDIMRNVKTRALTTFVQAFAIDQAWRLFPGTTRVFIGIDRQKKSEETLLPMLLQKLGEAGRPTKPKQAVVTRFLDSKSYHLIQAADWCAGVVRQFFEEKERAGFSLPCRACTTSNVLCRYRRRRISLTGTQLISKLLPLVPINERFGYRLTESLIIFPVESTKRLSWFDCILGSCGPHKAGALPFRARRKK